MAEKWSCRWSLACSCVKHGGTEAVGCLIGIKSDTLIRVVALTNVDFFLKIGYADSGGGIDKRGILCRARAKLGWAF